jgi:hypothetical protein
LQIYKFLAFMQPNNISMVLLIIHCTSAAQLIMRISNMGERQDNTAAVERNRRI